MNHGVLPQTFWDRFKGVDKEEKQASLWEKHFTAVRPALLSEHLLGGSSEWRDVCGSHWVPHLLTSPGILYPFPLCLPEAGAPQRVDSTKCLLHLQDL